jgi:hypothetical protein
MQQAIQHGGDSGAVAQQFAPVVHGSIRCEKRTGTFIAAHDDLQQFLGGGQRQLAHSQVVDDQQRHGGQQFHKLLALAIERGVGQFFQQCVGFAIQHAVALLDDGVPDGLCAVTFAAARWTKKQGIFALSDPVRRGQFEDQIAIHLGVELEVEVVQALVGIAELRLFVASLQQPLAAAGQFIGDQRGDQVDGRHVLRLRLQQARFHHGGHAAQAQLHQGAIEFDQVHDWVPRS